MRRAPPPAMLGLACLLAAAGLAGAQGHGERVDITGARFPSSLVADRPFYIDVDVQNKAGQAEDVQLYAVLYNMTGGSGPCDPAHTNQGLSVFRAAVHLGALQSVHVDGEQEMWRQEVNGSRLDGFGPHEACVWSQLANCPPGPVLACATDSFPVQVGVRAGNAPPRVAVQADRERAAAGQVVTLTASASDPDGDNLSLAWDLGDGSRAEGLRVLHRYAQPGVYRATFTASDGFDRTTRGVELVIGPPGSAKGTPGFALPALLGALGGAARVTRRAARRASPAAR